MSYIIIWGSFHFHTFLNSNALIFTPILIRFGFFMNNYRIIKTVWFKTTHVQPSLRICSDPDRCSKICRKFISRTYNFEIEINKKCYTRWTRLLIEVLEKSFCANLYRSLQILTDNTGFIDPQGKRHTHLYRILKETSTLVTIVLK